MKSNNIQKRTCWFFSCCVWWQRCMFESTFRFKTGVSKRWQTKSPSKLWKRISLAIHDFSITPDTERQDHSNPVKCAHARHTETASDVMKTHKTRHRETRLRAAPPNAPMHKTPTKPAHAQTHRDTQRHHQHIRPDTETNVCPNQAPRSFLERWRKNKKR